MTRHTSFKGKRQGFTLVEILVVLAIAAIVSSLTLGGYKEMAQGNKRVSCQTNLTQIYQAARLYASDEGGKFPSYSNPCDTEPFLNKQIGTGLWKLYTFPTKPEADTSATPPPLYKVNSDSPIERYLRSAKVLHCPADVDQKSDNLLMPGTSVIDEGYLSYQTCDDGDATPGVLGTPTYSTIRTTDTTDLSLWKRQLIHRNSGGFVNRQPTGDTVVTYCVYHRGQRDMDNVLFYDGTVQVIPKLYNGKTGWERKPKPPV